MSFFNQKKIRLGGKSHLFLVFFCLVMLFTSLPISAQATAPTAGALVTNTSSANYVNGVTGLEETVSSNTVSARVNAVPGLSLSDDVTLVRAPGDAVVFSYTLTNTGNTDIAASLMLSDFFGGFSVNLATIAVDQNGDGIAQDFELISVGDLVSLPVGASVAILVSGVVSELASVAETSAATLAVSSSDTDQTLSARAIVVIDTPTLTLSKAVSTDVAFVGDRLVYTLLIANNSQLPVLPTSSFSSDVVTVDNAIENVVAVVDPLPETVVFDSFIDVLDFDPVYHVRGDDAYSFSRSLPDNRDTIDRVAFLLDKPYAPGEIREVRFSVLVRQIATGTSIVNEAFVPLAQGAGALITVRSNSVATQVRQPTGGAQSIVIYDDPGFTQPTTFVGFGNDLYIEVSSQNCNMNGTVETISVVIETTPTGDRETFQAIETGPNSGVFRVGPINVSNVSSVNVNDGTLSANEDDNLQAHPQCDADITSAVPVETVGFVFDSLTNSPVQGVTVQLVDMAGGVVAVTITDSDGRFVLPIPEQGSFRVVIDNLSGYVAPSSVNNFDGFGRTIDSAGSFGEVFVTANNAGRIDFDIPVDAATVSTLSISKVANKKKVQIGELITYSIEVKTTAQAPVQNLTLHDELPWGVSLVPGSVRFAGVAVEDPAGVGTTSLDFDLGTIPAVSSTLLEYAVRVGPNAGPGDKVNLATASGQLGGLVLNSNVARATVRVDLNGTVFSREAIILGKVFLDCNRDGIQSGAQEFGIPGVQINTQEGVYVVTDAQGRFSLPRLRAKTHLLDVYDVTLPAGTKVVASRVMDAGKGGSRFVPLRAGEVRSEDFTVVGCAGEVLAEITKRRDAINVGVAGFDVAPLQLDTPNRNGFTETYEKSTSSVVFSDSIPEVTVAAGVQTQPLVSEKANPLGRDILSGLYAGPSVPLAVNSEELRIEQDKKIILKPEEDLLFPTHWASYTQESVLASKHYTYARLVEHAAATKQGAVPLQVASAVGLSQSEVAGAVVFGDVGRAVRSDIVEANASLAALVPEVISGVDAGAAYRARVSALAPLSFVGKKPSTALNIKKLESTKDLPSLIDGYTKELEFLDLDDGDIVSSRSVTIRVKGPVAGALSLFVNGDLVDAALIGQTVKQKKKNGIQLAEYIAVSLVEGKNELSLIRKDPFGNERGKKIISVQAVGAPFRVDVVAPQSAAADPQKPFAVVLRVVDRNDLPVLSPVEVTLSATEGEWVSEDIRDNESGVQNFVSDGQVEIEFKPSGLVGTHYLRVESNFGLVEVPVQFVADVNRPPVLVGFVEGAYSFAESNQKLSGLIENNQLSMFEETEEGVNGEVYLKGKIRGSALLTMRYESNRDVDGQLFRDIEPDRFYPVYGDRSEIGFDARSQGKLFVKVEKGLSYLLYGDVRYGAAATAFQLGAYQRTLEGARAHLEKGRLKVDLYAAETDATQTIVETPGLGISGPYRLDFDDVVENSETIEILVRDRDQPSVILSSQSLTRFAGYTLDYFDRSIIFSSPVPSIDENLNPVSIRVTFENNNGAGEKYYVYGGEARFELNERLAAGYRELRSDAPGLASSGSNDRRAVRAAYLEAKMGENGLVQLEVAQTTAEQKNENAPGQPIDEVTGEAVRFSYTRTGDKGSLGARIGYTDENFDAPGANQSAGNFEARVQGNRRVSEKLTLTTEGLYSDNTIRNETRYGIVGRVERNLDNQLSVRAGARYVGSDGIVDENGDEVDGLISAIVGASWAPHFLKGANFDAELEQSLTDTEHFRVKFGADYAITPKLKAYILSEWSSSDRGAFAIGESARSNTTIRGGVEAKLSDNVKVFSEYRANRGAFDAGLANGLTGSWDISESLQLRGRVEHVEPLTEVYQGNSAASIGATWQPEGGEALVSGDIEYALSQADRETWYVNNVVGLRKGDITFLARNRYARTEEAEGERVRDRLRVGAAYRPTDNEKINALAWYEYGVEEDAIVHEETHLWSVAGEYKPNATTRIRPRYAGQVFRTKTDSFEDKNTLHMLQLGADKDLTSRINLGVNLSGFTDEGFSNYNTGAGVEGSFLVMENVLLGLGYNYGTLKEEDFRDLYQEGFFVRLRVKFDENSWNIFDNR